MTRPDPTRPLSAKRSSFGLTVRALSALVALAFVLSSSPIPAAFAASPVADTLRKEALSDSPKEKAGLEEALREDDVAEAGQAGLEERGMSRRDFLIGAGAGVAAVAAGVGLYKLGQRSAAPPAIGPAPVTPTPTVPQPVPAPFVGTLIEPFVQAAAQVKAIPDGRVTAVFWDPASATEEDFKKLGDVGFNEVIVDGYKFVQEQISQEDMAAKVQAAQRAGITSFKFVMGSPDWAYASRAFAEGKTAALASKIVALRSRLTQEGAEAAAQLLTGVVLDVEPYLANGWDYDWSRYVALRDRLRGIVAAEKGLSFDVFEPFWISHSTHENGRAMTGYRPDHAITTYIMSYRRNGAQAYQLAGSVGTQTPHVGGFDLVTELYVGFKGKYEELPSAVATYVEESLGDAGRKPKFKGVFVHAATVSDLVQLIGLTTVTATDRKRRQVEATQQRKAVQEAQEAEQQAAKQATTDAQFQRLKRQVKIGSITARVDADTTQFTVRIIADKAIRDRLQVVAFKKTDIYYRQPYEGAAYDIPEDGQVVIDVIKRDTLGDVIFFVVDTKAFQAVAGKNMIYSPGDLGNAVITSKRAGQQALRLTPPGPRAIATQPAQQGISPAQFLLLLVQSGEPDLRRVGELILAKSSSDDARTWLAQQLQARPFVVAAAAPVSAPATGLEEISRRQFLQMGAAALLSLAAPAAGQAPVPGPDLATRIRGLGDATFHSQMLEFVDGQRIPSGPFAGLPRSYMPDPQNSHWKGAGEYVAKFGRVWIYDAALGIYADLTAGRMEKARAGVKALVELGRTEQAKGFKGGWHFSYNTRDDDWMDPRGPMGGVLWGLKAIYAYLNVALASEDAAIRREAVEHLRWANDLVKTLVFEMQVMDPADKRYGFVRAGRYNALLDVINPKTQKRYTLDEVGYRPYQGDPNKASEHVVFEHNADAVDVFRLAAAATARAGEDAPFITELARRHELLLTALWEKAWAGNHFVTAMNPDGTLNRSVAVDNNTWVAEVFLPYDEQRAWQAIEHVWQEFRTKTREGQPAQKIGDLVLEDVKAPEASVKALAEKTFAGLFFFSASFADPYVSVPDAEKPKLEQMVQPEATYGYIHFLLEFAKVTRDAQRRAEALRRAELLLRSMRVLAELYGGRLPYATIFVQEYFNSLASMASNGTAAIVEALIAGRGAPIGVIGVEPPAGFGFQGRTPGQRPAPQPAEPPKPASRPAQLSATVSRFEALAITLQLGIPEALSTQPLVAVPFVRTDTWYIEPFADLRARHVVGRDGQVTVTTVARSPFKAGEVAIAILPADKFQAFLADYGRAAEGQGWRAVNKHALRIFEIDEGKKIVPLTQLSYNPTVEGTFVAHRDLAAGRQIGPGSAADLAAQAPLPASVAVGLEEQRFTRRQLLSGAAAAGIAALLGLPEEVLGAPITIQSVTLTGDSQLSLTLKGAPEGAVVTAWVENDLRNERGVYYIQPIDTYSETVKGGKVTLINERGGTKGFRPTHLYVVMVKDQAAYGRLRAQLEGDKTYFNRAKLAELLGDKTFIEQTGFTVIAITGQKAGKVVTRSGLAGLEEARAIVRLFLAVPDGQESQPVIAIGPSVFGDLTSQDAVRLRALIGAANGRIVEVPAELEARRQLAVNLSLRDDEQPVTVHAYYAGLADQALEHFVGNLAALNIRSTMQPAATTNFLALLAQLQAALRGVPVTAAGLELLQTVVSALDFLA